MSNLKFNTISLEAPSFIDKSPSDRSLSQDPMLTSAEKPLLISSGSVQGPLTHVPNTTLSIRPDLVVLNNARAISDLRNPPANRLEKLAGRRKGQYSMSKKTGSATGSSRKSGYARAPEWMSRPPALFGPHAHSAAKQ